MKVEENFPVLQLAKKQNAYSSCTNTARSSMPFCVSMSSWTTFEIPPLNNTLKSMSYPVSNQTNIIKKVIAFFSLNGCSLFSNEYVIAHIQSVING